MSKEDDAIIQAVEAAISRSLQGQTGDYAKAAIAAYLDGLEKAGLGGRAVVPKGAITMGQMEAGIAAIADIDLPSDVKDRIVQRVYFATVAASPTPPVAE